jgi:pimeloyl-ACP methyl ester carboxylesterase
MATRVREQAAATVGRLERPDGVALAVETRGDPCAPAIVLAHGFGQTRRAWTRTADAFAARGYHVVFYDARGHGDSDWSGDAPYRWESLRDDLVAIARSTGTLPVLVGASMGGLVGLVAQAEFAPLFRALVLVDVTPRWEAAGVERILDFMRARPDGFDSIDEASEAVADYFPRRSTPRPPARLRALLADRGDGRLRWHWDPRLLDELAVGSAAHQPRLVDAASRIRVPTLLVSGVASDVVSRATIDEFLALVPHARHVAVPGATHMIVGDDNAAFTTHVVQFLSTLGEPAGAIAEELHR